MKYETRGINITTSTSIDKGKTAIFVKFMVVDEVSEVAIEGIKLAIAKEVWPKVPEWLNLPQ